MLVEFLEKSYVFIKVRGLPVISLDRVEVFSLPVDTVVDSYFIDFMREFIMHRHSQPLPSIGGLYPVPVLIFILFVLDIIKEYKNATSSMRLVRLHGREHITREQLARNPHWKRVVKNLSHIDESQA